MTRALLFASLLAAAFALTGCDTACDDLCDEMAAYWEDCGLPVGDSAVKDCKAAWDTRADPVSGEDENLYDKYQNTCRTLISKEENSDGQMVTALRARFTCKAMCEGPGGNFDGPGGGIDCSSL